MAELSEFGRAVWEGRRPLVEPKPPSPIKVGDVVVLTDRRNADGDLHQEGIVMGIEPDEDGDAVLRLVRQRMKGAEGCPHCNGFIRSKRIDAFPQTISLSEVEKVRDFERGHALRWAVNTLRALVADLERGGFPTADHRYLLGTVPVLWNQAMDFEAQA